MSSESQAQNAKIMLLHWISKVNFMTVINQWYALSLQVAEILVHDSVSLTYDVKGLYCVLLP